MSILPASPRSNRFSSNASGRLSATFGTLVTGGATAHTLGATFTDIFTSTAHDAYWVSIGIHATFAAGTRTDALLNLYIGASGEEQLLIPNLLAGWSADYSTTQRPRHYQFPLFIPAGSRISAKSQALQLNKAVYVWMQLEGGGQQPSWVGRAVETLGADTASSIGTSVTPGTAAEGTFTNIGTSGFDYRYVLPMIHGTLADTNIQFQPIHLDLGVGDALYRNVEDYLCSTHSSELTFDGLGGRGFFVHIPAATTLQLRGQVEGATAEAFDCCIYGVY